jgi:tetratricopeptide (TPR) repeat protein
MDISNSKNTNTGSINTNGGNVHLGDNYYNSIEYKELQEKITLLERLIKVTSVQEELIELQQKLTAEKDKLETFKKGVISLAKTFQKIKIDTQRLISAKAFFDKGKFKEARAILDILQISTEQEHLLNQKADLATKTDQNKSNLCNNADEYLVLAKLTAIDFDLDNRFKKTMEYFEASLKSDRNVENIFAYAYFLQEHNQNNRATPLYYEALEIHRKLVQVNPHFFLPDLANTLNKLATLHFAKNEFDKAEKTFLEALDIRRKLVEINLHFFLPDLATSLNNLAALHWAKNEFDKAEKKFLEALDIRRELAKANLQTYLPCLSNTLNNLAVLQKDKNEFKKAEKTFLEALYIGRVLVKVNPQTYLPYLASTLNNFANLYFAKNEFEKAEKAYLEALYIRRELVKVNPQTFLPDLASTLNNLANLQRFKNELDKAEKAYLETLEIRKKLTIVNPQTFLPDLAGSQINLGIFYQESKIDKKKSLQFIDEAVTNLLPLHQIPYIQNYIKIALNVLKKWDIDIEEYLNKKLNDND